ncbi:MAG TPA: hypothetical protein VGJ51_07605 [Candidatus Angelobacter sp.]|jgi:hypothetical protein
MNVLILRRKRLALKSIRGQGPVAGSLTVPAGGSLIFTARESQFPQESLELVILSVARVPLCGMSAKSKDPENLFLTMLRQGILLKTFSSATKEIAGIARDLTADLRG